MEWLRRIFFPTEAEKSEKKLRKLKKDIFDDFLPLPAYIFKDKEDMKDYMSDFYDVELTDVECDILHSYYYGD